jgi:flagellar biosynthesis GTPase FlhF
MEDSQTHHSNRLITSESDKFNFFSHFKALFKSAFVTNCHLDDASVTTEELETLEELDQAEILENLKDLVENLLNFKANVKSEHSGELAIRCEQLEKMLQKQESEVRSHIRNEHQLKIHIDSLQQKLVDLEKNPESQNVSRDEKEPMKDQLKKLEARFQKELNKINNKYKADSLNGKEHEKITKLEEMFEKKEKSYAKLQNEFQKIKGVLEETNKECKLLRKEVERYTTGGANSGALTKRKQEIIAENLNKVQLIGKTGIGERKKSHSKKKSCELFFHAGKFEPSPPFDGSRPHSVVRASLYNSRRHVRSNSEYARPASSKKIYVKH